VATPVGVGSTAIRASRGAISASTTLTVTSATLSSLAIAPAAVTLAQGTSTRLVATGTFSDGSTQDLTALASWSSDAPAAVSVAGGVATAGAPGAATLTATVGSHAATASATATSAALTSITVTAPAAPIPAGASQRLAATGHFSDGSTQDLTALAGWTSSAPAIAGVSNAAGQEGLVTAVAPGAATVTAALAGVSGSAPVTVSSATLVSLDVQPVGTTVAIGQTVQLAAIGTYTDASTRDLTAEAVWSSSDETMAAISSAAGSEGLAKGLALGTVTVTAQLGAVSGSTALGVAGPVLVAISVTPAPGSVAKGLVETFTATGFLSDGSTEDVTGAASWATLDASVAAATGNVVTGVDVGVTDVVASWGGVTGSATLVVGPPVVLAVELTAAEASIAVSTSTQYDAVALLSDGSKVDVTATAAWSALPAGVATASGGGLVTGVAAGAATVSATTDGVTGSASLAVTGAVLRSIVVTPAAPRVPLGVQQPFAATGLFSDGTSQDLTGQVSWTSAAPAVATVTAAGVATPTAPGTTSIGAALGGLSGSTSFTVTAAALVAVEVTPPSATFAAGTSFPYAATATWSDGSTQDVTGIASWSSSAPGTVATVGGLATGVAAGGATLTASLSGSFGTAAGTAAATVTSASLRTLAVTPSGARVPAGVAQRLAATGAYSDGSTQDLTASATWSSSVTTVAAVSNAPGREGLVTALGAGATTIAAAVGAVAGSAPLTVTAATLASLDVQPATTVLGAGQTLQYRATGTFTDASTRDLTSAVTWSSSDVAVAVVSGAPGAEGLAKGLAPGVATVTAQLGSVSQGATLQIAAPVLASVVVSPHVASVPKGLSQTFTAQAVYSDGSSQDVTGSASWTTLDPSVAAAAGSEVQGIAVGVTQVEASFGGLSGSAGLVVSGPVVVQVGLSPAAATLAAGTQVQYLATAVYSDGAKVDVTPAAAWAATPAGLATITQGGLATGLAVGTATVSASAFGVTGYDPLTVTTATLQAIALSPTGATMPYGVAPNVYPVQFTAIGLFTDGTSQDLTAQVAWDATGSATISATGLAAPIVGPGSATVTASRGGVSAATTLSVTNATLTSYAIDQANVSFAAGTTFPFTVTATFSDSTVQDLTAASTWSSRDGSVATISNAPSSEGLATAVAPGSTTLDADYGNGAAHDSTPIAVTTAILTGLDVQPVTTTLPVGSALPFTATGSFSDGTTQDLTAAAGWTSSVTTIAAVSNAPGQEGLVTGVAPGTARVAAAYQGRSASATVTVTSATVASIDVMPISTTVPKSYTQQLRAYANYTDGTRREVTTQATWSSSSTTIATVSNAAGTRGLATGVAVGSVSIQASFGGKSGQGQLTVANASLTGITVVSTTGSLSVARRGTLQLQAIGTFTGGLTVDVTRQCAWSSSQRSAATVSKAGLVTAANKTGVVTIQAKKGPTRGQADLTVY
jgi:hypothetical protein